MIVAMKLHLAVTGKSAFGGALTTTLCGRMNAQCVDGMNSTEDRAKVTCENCRKILRSPWHPRFRRFITGLE